MAKAKKFRALARRAGGKAKDLGSKALASGVGGDVLEVGSHAALALFTKQSGDALPIKPDAAALGLSVLGMMFAKGGSRKVARRIMKGSLHALVTRAVTTGTITIVSGPPGAPPGRADRAGAA